MLTIGTDIGFLGAIFIVMGISIGIIVLVWLVAAIRQTRRTLIEQDEDRGAAPPAG